jgi:hypothetical protein
MLVKTPAREEEALVIAAPEAPAIFARLAALEAEVAPERIAAEAEIASAIDKPHPVGAPKGLAPLAVVVVA